MPLRPAVQSDRRTHIPRSESLSAFQGACGGKWKTGQDRAREKRGVDTFKSQRTGRFLNAFEERRAPQTSDSYV